MRLDNEVLANKDEVDKDEIENHMIVRLVTLALHAFLSLHFQLFK